MKLKSYDDFIDRVNELGFMPLSELLPGLPSVSGETDRESWHTNDPNTDPWQWKDRAAVEKKLAYGCVIGGHKGFIAMGVYPLFYLAYHPRESMQTRWQSGVIDQMTWELWQLFCTNELLNTSEIRKRLGVTRKKGGSRVDASIKKLQSEFYITVAGNVRKLNKRGEPYGWPVTVLAQVPDFLPEWLEIDTSMQPEAAQQLILDLAQKLGSTLKREQLAKKIGLPLC